MVWQLSLFEPDDDAQFVLLSAHNQLSADQNVYMSGTLTYHAQRPPETDDCILRATFTSIGTLGVRFTGASHVKICAKSFSKVGTRYFLLTEKD